MKWKSFAKHRPKNFEDILVITEDNNIYIASNDFEAYDDLIFLNEDEGKQVVYWMYLSEIRRPLLFKNRNLKKNNPLKLDFITSPQEEFSEEDKLLSQKAKDFYDLEFPKE